MPAARSERIRLGVVGYGTPRKDSISGRGGRVFTQAVQSFEGIVPAAICDTNPLSLRCAAEDLPGVPLFDDYETMLRKSELDALFVATPATGHAEFAVRALERNIHVLSEIPVVASADEARRLWEAHQRSRALFMTGANPNFWYFVEAAVDLKNRGELGEPYYIDAEYIHAIQEYFEATPWRASYEPIRYCTHSLGPMLRLIDEDLEWTTCFDTGSHVNRQAGQHDVMTALFRTASSVVVRLTVSFVNHYPSGGHYYRLFTTKGAFERTRWYAQDCPAKTLTYTAGVRERDTWLRLPADYIKPEHAGNAKATGHGGADYALLEAFFKALRGGGPSPVTLREGLRMTLPGIYAAESAQRGGELTRIRYPWN